MLYIYSVCSNFVYCNYYVNTFLHAFENFCGSWLEFFGRVKDKAGDMERILKEKDKHGNKMLC